MNLFTREDMLKLTKRINKLEETLKDKEGTKC
jgi:hypothetical protein